MASDGVHWATRLQRPGGGVVPPESVVVIAGRELVGSACVAQAFRECGQPTLRAGSASETLRRLSVGLRDITAVVVVGDLGDGSAGALRRWMRGHGHRETLLIGIGVELDPDDPHATSITAERWAGDHERRREVLDRVVTRASS